MADLSPIQNMSLKLCHYGALADLARAAGSREIPIDCASNNSEVMSMPPNKSAQERTNKVKQVTLSHASSTGVRINKHVFSCRGSYMCASRSDRCRSSCALRSDRGRYLVHLEATEAAIRNSGYRCAMCKRLGPLYVQAVGTANRASGCKRYTCKRLEPL